MKQLKRDISLLSLAVSTALLLSFSTSWAHHGWGGYKADIDTNVVITELNLGGSHDHLNATDSEGAEWDLVLATPTRNRRLGFDENSLSVGDEVNLIGRLHPSKPEVKVHCIYKNGETVYTYYDWDGTTSLSKHSDRDQC